MERQDDGTYLTVASFMGPETEELHRVTGLYYGKNGGGTFRTVIAKRPEHAKPFRPLRKPYQYTCNHFDGNAKDRIMAMHHQYPTLPVYLCDGKDGSSRTLIKPGEKL